MNDDLRAYVERDPERPGRWEWWVTDKPASEPRILNLPQGRAGSRRRAARQARRGLAYARRLHAWRADLQREEIR